MSPEETKIITLPDRLGPLAPVQSPPSYEPEQALLGAILVRPEVFPAVIDAGVKAESFSGPAHATIFKAMLDLHGERAPIDLVTVTGRLKERGKLEASGGQGFLMGLSEEVGYSSNAEYYAHLVLKDAWRREYRQVLLQLHSLEQDPTARPADLMSMLNSKLVELEAAYPRAAGDSFAAYAKLAYNVEQFQKLILPPKDKLLYPWLTAYQMLQIYGPRGGGKTAFVLGVLGAVAKGLSFGPWPAGEAPVKCLYLDGELPAQDVQVRNEQLDLANISTPENLTILSNALVVEAGLKRVSLRDTEWMDGFKRFLIDQDIKLWAADNLSSLATGAENAVEDWTPVNMFFLDLRALGITTSFVHHAGKSGGQRGTSGREDNLDTSILIKPTSDAHLVPGPKFTVTFEKNRIPRGEGYHLIKETEMELIKDPDDPTGLNLPGLWTYRTTASKKSEQGKAKTLELVGAGFSRAEIAKKLGVERSTVTRRITRAIEEGFLSDNEKLTPAGVDFVMKNLPGEDE
jgi:hypothetical protein